MAGRPVDKTPIKKVSTIQNLSMPTLMEEIKSVVLVKYEFEYRGKLKLKGFHEFSEYQDSDAKQKINKFLVEYSSARAVFLITILIEEIELLVAEN